MSRVIALGPGGRAQAPVRDDRCRPVIEVIRAAGLLGSLRLSPPCKNYEEAWELRQAMFRSARYYCACGAPNCTRKHRNYPPDNGCPDGGQRISCAADVVLWTHPETGKEYHCVQYKLTDKREAMRAVIQKYGPDPNNWPYFARRRRLKEKR